MVKKNYSKIYTKKCDNLGNCKKYCLDVASGSCKNNIPIISYPCHNGSNQQFHYNKTTKQLKSKSSDKCLDIVNNQVVQKACNKRRRTQKWKRKGKHFKSLSNRKCIDVDTERYDNGKIITYKCHKRNNQNFYVKE